MDQGTHIGQGIIREWLYDGKIIAYRGVTPTRAAIDIWVADVQTALDGLANDQKLYVMNDLTAAPMMMTPYAQQALRQLSQYKSSRQGATALILKPSPATVLLRAFMSTIAHERFHPHIFFRPDDGLKWLQKQLSPLPA
ncbi:MAG: hypothetical protein OHK0023_04990 [Anaerolineae bacterium]